MDRQLKQRVVGAGLLVAFGVIFIPIFLDNGGVESTVPPSMNIPPAPTEDVSKRAPALDDDAVAEMDARADEDVELPPPRMQPGEGSAAPAPLENSSTSGAAEAVPAADGGPAAEAGSEDAKPEDAPPPRMEGAAVPSALATPAVKATTTHPAADSAGAHPATKSPAKPAVETRLPAKAAVESKPSLPLAVKPAAAPPAVSGWTVQLGSFSSDINARKLVDKLRAAGYKAYSEPRTEQGVVVFKVRVGPSPGRAEAERVRQRIEAQFDARGMLVPAH